MFFIFGVGPKTQVVEKKQFKCPVCHTCSNYELRQQRQYFSLFFIALFPVSRRQNTTVKCLHCGTVMPSMVLHHTQQEAK
nr:zinc-ribbon domain-containing protein [uncultured Acinetobacter sp.]